MRYALRWHFEVTSSASDDELGDHVDCVMLELLKLEGCVEAVRDAAIGLDADRGKVEIELTVAADDLPDAIREGQAVIRSAVHAAGGYTSGWDDKPGVGVEYEFVDVTLEVLASVPA